jgi:hypothetical protein
MELFFPALGRLKETSIFDDMAEWSTAFAI